MPIFHFFLSKIPSSNYNLFIILMSNNFFKSNHFYAGWLGKTTWYSALWYSTHQSHSAERIRRWFCWRSLEYPPIKKEEGYTKCVINATNRTHGGQISGFKNLKTFKELAKKDVDLNNIWIHKIPWRKSLIPGILKMREIQLAETTNLGMIVFL